MSSATACFEKGNCRDWKLAASHDARRVTHRVCAADVVAAFRRQPDSRQAPAYPAYSLLLYPVSVGCSCALRSQNWPPPQAHCFCQDHADFLQIAPHLVYWHDASFWKACKSHPMSSRGQ